MPPLGMLPVLVVRLMLPLLVVRLMPLQVCDLLLLGLQKLLLGLYSAQKV